jgi:hypothetical protein
MGAIDTEASDETGINYTEDQRTRRAAIQLGAGFNRAVKDDPSFKGAKGKAESFDEMKTALGQTYGFMDAEGNPIKGKPAPDPAAHDRMALIGTDIMRSGLPAETAARMLQGVATGALRPQITQRGNENLVSFGNGMPPVRLSEDAFLQLSRLAGASAKPGALPPTQRWRMDPSVGDSSTALPGRTGNTRPRDQRGVNLDMPYGGASSPLEIADMLPSEQAGAVDIYGQRQEMLRRRAQAAEGANASRQPTLASPGEEAYLRQRLGRFARPGMTIQELRQEEQALTAMEMNRGMGGRYGRR